MKGERGEPSDARMVVQTLRVGERVYEQRYNRCGRLNCNTCYAEAGAGGGRVGHGPYWYLCGAVGRRWKRVYIGKNLNTELYATPGGAIDWNAVKGSRKDRRELARQRAERTKGHG